MSDLVTRLRDCANGVGDFKTDRGDYGVCEDAADEIEKLREALRNIARPQYGLQGIQEDYGHDANKYNFHAMEYWSRLCTRHANTAREAMFNSTGEV